MSELEIRQWNARAAMPTVTKENKLSGRAAPFMSPTLIGNKKWGFREQIKPSAFNKTIKDGDQVLLDNHIASRPLARSSAGTLEMHATGNKGLDWQANASDTSYARDVLENVRAGNYGGCSFSFEVVSDTWDEDTSDGIPLRTLNEVNCREISIVTFPAYPDTSVGTRSQVDLAMEYRYRFWAPVMESYFEDRDDRSDNKPYGDVAYADPKNGKYPIDTKEHAKAAWSYINKPENAAKYPMNGVTLSSVKDKIRAACKKFGVQISDEQNSADDQPEARVFENEDFRITTVGEWDDRQWAAFQEELKWINKTSGLGPDGEPDDSTRSLTKEEHALLEKRMADQRRAIFNSRKPSFTK